MALSFAENAVGCSVLSAGKSIDIEITFYSIIKDEVVVFFFAAVLMFCSGNGSQI